MPKKPILDYSRYFAFRDGAAFCTVAGCKRPDWAYSLKNGQTTSMLKHLREKHPDKYEEGVLLQVCTLAAAAVVSGTPADDPPADDPPADDPPADDPPADEPPAAPDMMEVDDIAVVLSESSGGSPMSISPPKPLFSTKPPPRRRAVIEDSSDDDLPGPSNAVAQMRISSGIPGVTGPSFFGSLGTEEMKQKLALLTARKKADEAEKEVLRRIAPAEAAEGRRELPDRPGRKLGQLLSKLSGPLGESVEMGGLCPVFDVGDGSVLHVQKSVPHSSDEGGDADSSTESGDEAPSSHARDRFPVEKIVRKRVINGRVELLTKWRGWRQWTWEPYSNFDKDNAALKAFELSQEDGTAESTDEENVDVTE